MLASSEASHEEKGMNRLIHSIYLLLNQSENLWRDVECEDTEDRMLIETDLTNYWIKDLFAKEIPGYTELTVYETNGWVTRILNVETSEMKHVI